MKVHEPFSLGRLLITYPPARLGFGCRGRPSVAGRTLWPSDPLEERSQRHVERVGNAGQVLQRRIP